MWDKSIWISVFCVYLKNVSTVVLSASECVSICFYQPSTLIVIAISPKYKADIEGSVVDNHSLHTRYIYTMVSPRLSSYANMRLSR